MARHKFIDAARREQRWRSKLELIHRDETTADQGTGTEPDGSEVLDCLADLQPLHRAVLVLRYVDGLSVPEVAAAIGRDVTPTNSLLARARAELRSASGGNPDA